MLQIIQPQWIEFSQILPIPRIKKDSLVALEGKMELFGLLEHPWWVGKFVKEDICKCNSLSVQNQGKNITRNPFWVCTFSSSLDPLKHHSKPEFRKLCLFPFIKHSAVQCMPWFDDFSLSEHFTLGITQPFNYLN